MAYHCTICGKTYGFLFVPKDKPTSGKRKGKKTPMCCNKQLSKISQLVRHDIEKQKKEIK